MRLDAVADANCAGKELCLEYFRGGVGEKARKQGVLG